MTRSRRAAVLVAGAAAALVVVVGLLVAAQLADDGDDADASARDAGVVAGTTRAVEPFASMTAGTIRVGGRRLEVVVADSVGERIQGLRGRSDAAPYDGMLFVFDGDATGAFTMAGVPEPLEIAFFDARGRRVDTLRMEPCAGTDATCPVYEASAPYRYSLETAPGGMPTGDLRVRGTG